MFCCAGNFIHTRDQRISEHVTVNKMIIDTGGRMFEMNIIDQYVSTCYQLSKQDLKIRRNRRILLKNGSKERFDHEGMNEYCCYLHLLL